jgi:hypothetical protein
MYDPWLLRFLAPDQAARRAAELRRLAVAVLGDDLAAQRLLSSPRDERGEFTPTEAARIGGALGAKAADLIRRHGGAIPHGESG